MFMSACVSALLILHALFPLFLKPFAKRLIPLRFEIFEVKQQATNASFNAPFNIR